MPASEHTQTTLVTSPCDPVLLRRGSQAQTLKEVKVLSYLPFQLYLMRKLHILCSLHRFYKAEELKFHLPQGWAYFLHLT